MSVSIQDWNTFMNKVGEDFYDFIHGVDDENTQYTPVSYPYVISYTGVETFPIGFSSSYADNLHPFLCYFALDNNSNSVLNVVDIYDGWTNKTGSNAYSYLNNFVSLDFNIDCLNSFSGSDFLVDQNNQVLKLNASGNNAYSIFKYDFVYQYYTSSSHTTVTNINKSLSGKTLHLNSNSTDVYTDYTDGFGNRYDYFFTGNIPALVNSYYEPSSNDFLSPARINNQPLIINSANWNVNNSFNTNVKNQYINNGDTITTYNYTTNEGDNITINYSIDGDGVPTGYIDMPISPDVGISFDDLFDMFNTILAPLVGVGLDLPDWNDFQPPVVTGDIIVNVDLPDVTGEYPAETITPIESDVYNIMSIDSMPQLPSLTGIDNGESSAALGASFTFLDGCGLLMPFLTIAIIRLLISKFRGDS